MASRAWLPLAATCACLLVGAADSQCTGALDTPPAMSGITPSRKVKCTQKVCQLGDERVGKEFMFSDSRLVWLPQDLSKIVRQ